MMSKSVIARNEATRQSLIQIGTFYKTDSSASVGMTEVLLQFKVVRVNFVKNAVYSFIEALENIRVKNAALSVVNHF